MRMAILILLLGALLLPTVSHSGTYEECRPPKEEGDLACAQLFAGSAAVGACQACYTAAFNACVEPTGTTQQFVQCDPIQKSTPSRNNQKSPVVWNCSILEIACKTRCASLSGNESFKTACTDGCSTSMVAQQCSDEGIFFPEESLTACLSAAEKAKSVVIAVCNASSSKNKFPNTGRNERRIDDCEADAMKKFNVREKQCYGSFGPLSKPQGR